MDIVTTSADLAALPRVGTRAVVMTMGALHEGHLALTRRAAELADQVVVTIFVNPLQFNDPADLEKYPRDVERDVALLSDAGVDVLYVPDVEDVYPGGTPIVTVSAGPLGAVFEGEYRPGHFDGVLTVVLKLMNLTGPDVALFGQKDAQQLIAIRTMVRDLNVPVEVLGVPTVRGVDGLALSSRNQHLSEADHVNALALIKALKAADAVATSGADVPATLAAGLEILANAPGVHLDYFAALDPGSAQPVPSDYRGEVVIAVAARVGSTRLIDNVTTRIGV
ncbi:MAG: pantoate--beta-alanine ligase [Actinobacteria bacterium HGW-Actinobacteria-4]|nr:MAG: pantoate--beta-alanine ligase [Actinobacteria bacterium HGW-Actinobacteria-4]